MAYLSEFEVLSEYIVPPALLPPGSTVPFSLKGYFAQLSRLEDDGIAGDLHLRVRFHPSTPLPTANLIADEQTAAGGTNILTLSALNEVDVAIPPGKTILVGIQPNFTNQSPTGPLVATFGTRGYVTLKVIAPTKPGFYKLAVLPEHRVTFCVLQSTPTGPAPDFSTGSSIAYALPTKESVIVLEG